MYSLVNLSRSVSSGYNVQRVVLAARCLSVTSYKPSPIIAKFQGRPIPLLQKPLHAVIKNDYRTYLNFFIKRNVSFNYVKKVMCDPSIYLIDVRTPDEVKERGSIPHSLKIDLHDIEDVLQNMTDPEFLKKYGRPKPTSQSEIIFFCRSGNRSALAMKQAKSLGFKYVKNYTGGYTDWEIRISKILGNQYNDKSDHT